MNDFYNWFHNKYGNIDKDWLKQMYIGFMIEFILITFPYVKLRINTFDIEIFYIYLENIIREIAY